MSQQDLMFMQQALRQAHLAQDQDEVPVGTVIVHNNQIIARAHNQVEMLKDPTAHSEMIALTQASNFLKQKWLHECTVYVTLEPCAMCAGALVLARVSRLVFGAEDPKSGACGSVLNVTDHPQLNHRVDVVGGIMASECGALLSNFFQKKRQRL